jgi:hypothetical protein
MNHLSGLKAVKEVLRKLVAELALGVRNAFIITSLRQLKLRQSNSIRSTQ